MESRTPNPYAIIDDEPSFDPYSETNTTVESANVEQPTKVVTIPVSPVYQTVVIEPNEVVTLIYALVMEYGGYIAACPFGVLPLLDVLQIDALKALIA